MTELEIKNNLYEILVTYASVADNSVKALNIVDKMIENPETTVKDYVMALADGLRYGNWPWTDYQTTKEDINQVKLTNMYVKGMTKP